MGRGARKRVAANIYADRAGFSVTVKVSGVQRERRYPKETPLSVMKRWRDETRVALRKALPSRSGSTFAQDVETYITQMKHLASWRERHAELKAWIARVGTLPRTRITADHVREARAAWLAAGKAPKTVNMRVASLQHLFRVLGATPELPRPWTPCDGIKPLPVHRTPAVAVPHTTIAAVAAKLEEHERIGWLRSAKTRARFMVLASTGKRPSELMRAQPQDVDFVRRVWTVRDGKGGWSPGIYLNDDMLVAWRLFVKADAWGVFEVSSYDQRLYKAGWPKEVRPYNLRHTVGIGLSELGVDLADIQAHMGHRRIETTRKHYVPVLHSRLEEASRRLDHRFGWGPRREKKKRAS
jgi:integrase